MNPTPETDSDTFAATRVLTKLKKMTEYIYSEFGSITVLYKQGTLSESKVE